MRITRPPCHGPMSVRDEPRHKVPQSQPDRTHAATAPILRLALPWSRE